MNARPSGLRFIDDEIGTGDEARVGHYVSVHYTGWLAKDDDEKGEEFDSSRPRQMFFSFTLGRGEVITGWDQGLLGMRVGGKRTLYIPAHMGYGAHGAGDVIPPNADLIFEVELLALR